MQVVPSAGQICNQGGTICGAIEGSSRSLKSIDKRVFIHFCDKYAVFINFRDKNAVFTSFCDKNYVFELHDKNTVFGSNFSVQDRINQLTAKFY